MYKCSKCNAEFDDAEGTFCSQCNADGLERISPLQEESSNDDFEKGLQQQKRARIILLLIVAIGFVAFIVLLAIRFAPRIFPYQVPEESYLQHPELVKTKGRLVLLLRTLPLGVLQGEEEWPKPHERGGQIALTNLDQLSPFLLRQNNSYNTDRIAAEAEGWYSEDGKPPYSFAYAVLMPKGQKPQIQKRKFYSGMPGLLGRSPSIKTSFELRRVTNLLSGNDNCRLYLANGSIDSPGLLGASADSSDMNYVILAGRFQNIYLEIAVPGTLEGNQQKDDFDNFEDEEAWSRHYDSPPLGMTTTATWETPLLATLKQAHNEAGFGTCKRVE